MIATTVGDQPEVAKVILSKPGIKSLRDVAHLNVDQLTKLIAPLAKPGTKAYQQAKRQAIAINNLIKERRTPASYHIMLKDAKMG